MGRWCKILSLNTSDRVGVCVCSIGHFDVFIGSDIQFVSVRRVLVTMKQVLNSQKVVLSGGNKDGRASNSVDKLITRVRICFVRFFMLVYLYECKCYFRIIC